MPSDVLMPPRYFKLLFRHFATTPDLRVSLLEGTSLSEDNLSDPNLETTLSQLLALHDNLAQLFGDNWAAVTADLWTQPTLGAMGIANQYAPDLNTAVSLIVAYGRAAGPLWDRRLERGEERSKIVFDLLTDLREDHRRRTIEIGFFGLRQLLLLYLRRAPSEVRYRFKVGEPRYAPDIRAVLGDNVSYDTSENALDFPTSWLDIKSPLADPIAFRFSRLQLEAEHAALSHAVPIRGRVERLLRNAEVCPTQPRAADQLGLSLRTLVRRLHAARTSYRALLDAERRRRAEAFLHAGTETSAPEKIAQVAEHLGYSDPGSFARARRRWARTAG